MQSEQTLTKPDMTTRSSDPAGRLLGTLGRIRPIPLVLFVILLLLTALPLASVILASFRPLGLPLSDGWTLDHFSSIWSDAYTYRLIGNTFVFAGCSTALALVIAGALAWLIERTDLPGRGFFMAVIVMPMATPPILLAIGWVLLMSPAIGAIPKVLDLLTGGLMPEIPMYSLGGMIWVQSLAMVPTSFLILAPAMRNMDPSFEEAAFMSGASFWQTLRRVSLPFLTPPILSLVTLLFIVCMLSFDVPAVIGMPGNVAVMSSEIYNLMHPSTGLPDYGKTAALNSSLLVLLVAALWLYYRSTKQTERFRTISGKGYKATRFSLGRFRWLAIGGVSLYFVLAALLPFLALLWVSLAPYYSGFSLDLVPQLSFNSMIGTFTRDRVWTSTVNSVVVATTCAVGLSVLSLLLGWTIVRSRSRLSRALDIMSMVPIAIPHLMMGVALIFIFFSFRFLPLYGTIWIIALGQLIIYLPVGSRMMQAAVIQLHSELEEAGEMSGASNFQIIRRILVPLVRGTLVGLFIWIFVHSFREFSVAAMLQSGRNDVLSTVLYSYWESGQPDAAASIAVVMMVVLCLSVVLGRMLGASEGR
ncbi:ABC transporter permease [Celeribacter indicus]|uniref:Binding-protein-dependent transport system inner membrane protein n=1 Tax=Celeribacter indicus TaxID=1208324 RepID=A0A0B5DUR1_9RHOB|nr:iron ABC transporter permease [Celeribacter indicus]AJE46764.1 binding-protein-dependent transport system inner membrane protein [Celeribacter indicus]SDX05843.1 iron(III) transport system permease protein [Celeribacter indicus]